MSAENIDRLQQLFIKAKQWQIVTDKHDVSQLFDKCDMALFKSSLNINHCLRHLYPDKRHHVHSMTLRPRGHNFRFLNVGFSVPETRTLIGYCLHVYNVQFILKFHRYFCNSERLTLLK